ncbi:MAG: hypothetical protein COC19_02365, partial [SAR86 cluster bacterium]
MISRSIPLIFSLLATLTLGGLCSTAIAEEAVDTNDGGIWIDVRSKRAYRAGHLEGAINIPHGDIGHKIFAAAPDLYQIVHIYDGTLYGTFAGLALEMLMELGYQEVVN